MNYLDVTSRMVDYIRNNHIEVERVAMDTNVPACKLKGESKEKLTSIEFLSLCQYLHIQPEDFK